MAAPKKKKGKDDKKEEEKQWLGKPEKNKVNYTEISHQ